jgi:4-carboxymuconolactone decarboxylase
MTMPRLDRLYPKDMTEEQRDYHRTISSRPTYAGSPENSPLLGPSGIYQRSVAYGRLKNAMSQYLRHESPLPGHLRELTIITVCRLWDASYAFCEHERIARRAGVDEAIISAIRKGETPDFKNEDEAIVYRFVRQTVDDKAVDDETYNAAFDLLGPKQLVDVIGLCGHYVTAAMTLNAFEEPPRDGDEPLPPR